MPFFHDLSLVNALAPIVFAMIFIAAMSLLEPQPRQQFNAILVAGAGAAYFSGGFGPWELVYTAVATAVAYLGLKSWRYIGLAWLMHASWDVAHHLYGHPIIVFIGESSRGCAIFDTAIAIWFFAGAPDIWRLIHASQRPG